MRLRNPEKGTVVSVGEDLESLYRARGWVDADAKPAPEPEADPEPKRRGRPPTTK